MTAPVRSRRSLTVLVAVLAPALVWLVTDPLLGHRLRITDPEAGETLDIGLLPVVVLALLVSLLGWGLLAALERFTGRARLLWTVAAFAVLLLSFLPLTGSGMSGGTRTSLALMHLAVAAALMAGLPRPEGRPTERSPAPHG
ncbi:DUF6069 family protein [Streptomyces sp. NPDC012600]|uniref:DUF6069 family protein n=1 Tax=Streptomyces sp. NPDC012600 TaxID=3415005 RepID=UPI003C302D21